MSILGSRTNEVFWDMAKRGKLNDKFYKKSLKFLNLKRCEGEPQFDSQSFHMHCLQNSLVVKYTRVSEKFEIQLPGVTCMTQPSYNKI